MQRIKVCVYSGCDYLSNVNGLGFATAMRLVNEDQLDFFVKNIFKRAENIKEILPDGISSKEKYWKRFQ